MSHPGVFQNTDQAMQTGITALETAVDDCNRIYNTVMETASSLAHSWQGEASAAYQNLLQSWQDDFHTIIQSLDGMHENLINNKTAYDRMEHQNTQAASAGGR